MADIKFNYRDLQEIFGDERKIELIDGEIVVGGKPFDEVVAKYLELKAKKSEDAK